MATRAMMALGVGLVFCAGCASGPAFHVSVDGDDQNPGTKANPFRTMARARDALRAARAKETPAGETITDIVLHGGRYFLPQPVEFTAADSGAAGKTVVYRAAPGEDVWLSGGVPLSPDSFAPVIEATVLERIDPVAREHVRRLELSDDLLAQISPQWPDAWFGYRRNVTCLSELFAGDRRLPMARWPNEGYTEFGAIVIAGENEGDVPTFKYTCDRPERWLSAVPDGLWLYGYWRRGYRAEHINAVGVGPTL